MYKIKDLTKDINLKLLKHYKSLLPSTGLGDYYVYMGTITAGSPQERMDSTINLLVFNYLLLHQDTLEIPIIWNDIISQGRHEGRTTSVKGLIGYWITWGNTANEKRYSTLYEKLNKIPSQTLDDIKSAIKRSLRTTFKNLIIPMEV